MEYLIVGETQKCFISSSLIRFNSQHKRAAKTAEIYFLPEVPVTCAPNVLCSRHSPQSEGFEGLAK